MPLNNETIVSRQCYIKHTVMSFCICVRVKLFWLSKHWCWVNDSTVFVLHPTKCGSRAFKGGSGRRAVAQTRPTSPKIPRAPSAFPEKGAPQTINLTPPKRVKAWETVFWGSRYVQRRDTPDQIRAEVWPIYRIQLTETNPSERYNLHYWNWTKDERWVKLFHFSIKTIWIRKCFYSFRFR